MNSIEFVRTRAQASRSAQVILAAPPTSPVWVWSRKPLVQWGADLAELDLLRTTESERRTDWRNAAESWQADLNRIQQITRDVAGYAASHFYNDEVKLRLFEPLQTDGRSRPDVYQQGLEARSAWSQTDPAWVIVSGGEEVTNGSFGSLLAAAVARQTTYSDKLAAWRYAASALMNKAQKLDADNVAWYADATRRFPEGTTEGDMIRSTVPTTTTPPQPVGQAVIANAMASGGDVHFDVSAPHATRYTYLQQVPGSPAFVVVLADSAEDSLTLHGQPPGLHRFKVVGSNSLGEGQESAVVEVAVAQAAAG